jgi:PAS domain S-box-containing protein
MRAYAIIPVLYKRQHYGNIVLCFKDRHIFTSQDRGLSISLGNATAQTLTINSLHKNLKEERNKLEQKVKQRTTQLEIMNEKLAQDRAEDEALLSSIGEGIIATDKQSSIILINPQAVKILGGTVKDYIGKSLLETQPLWDEKGQLIDLENRPTFLALYQGVQTYTSPAHNYFMKNHKGHTIPVAITATPVYYKGELLGAIQILRDITEEKNIDKAKSELISLASHQLRTPLAAINWYTEALLSGELGKSNSDQKRYLKQIFDANQKMIELVYDFLNVSRIELGTFSLKISTLSVIELADGVIKELEPVIKQKKLKIQTDFGQGLEQLELDRKIIRIIFQNLLSNSVKYTEKGGKINLRVGLSKNGRDLEIEVSDNGYGIPKNQQSKIFSKLFRADNIVRLDTEGTGLGLYIVKSLVDFCLGHINFKSQENKGSKFNVSLPLQTFKTPVLENT